MIGAPQHDPFPMGVDTASGIHDGSKIGHPHDIAVAVHCIEEASSKYSIRHGILAVVVVFVPGRNVFVLVHPLPGWK